jgi:hypothetical protein
MSMNRALARGRSCNTRNMSGEDDQEILRMVTLSLGMLKQDMSHARTSTMATDGLVPPTTVSFRACSFATISSSRWMTQTSTCGCLDGSSSRWGGGGDGDLESTFGEESDGGAHTNRGKGDMPLHA